MTDRWIVTVFFSAGADLRSSVSMLNLAAMRGSEEARQHRRELSAEIGRESVADAQRAAREWLAAA